MTEQDVVMEQTEPKFQEMVYERFWVIPGWDRIQRCKRALASQNFVFETGKPTGVQTKWKTGFKFNNSGFFYLYWKLIETKGYPDEKVQASTSRWILKDNCPVHLIETPKHVISLGKELEATEATLCFNSERWVSESWLNSNGEVTFKLKVTIMEPEKASTELKTALFHKASLAHMQNNFASLLQDRATADLKIITSDEKDLFARKIILKVQCPVFESMFRSDCSENQTGIVIVKDVNAKTMGILLHLFYTGELLPSWKDDDTVVGFTYAVGKYQLANVLKFLDEVLGSRDEEDTFQRDVQLLDLARKLDLKIAQVELLARIKQALCKVNSGAEFFDLYAW